MKVFEIIKTETESTFKPAREKRYLVDQDAVAAVSHIMEFDNDVIEVHTLSPSDEAAAQMTIIKGHDNLLLNYAKDISCYQHYRLDRLIKACNTEEGSASIKMIQNLMNHNEEASAGLL